MKGGSMDLNQEIEMLKSMILPTPNKQTDSFGLHRDWAPNGEAWNPDSEYSPVHVGVDYSARPETKIRMPCDGKIYGEMIGGLVGSYCMIVPTDTAQIALYYHHCEPTANVWVPFHRGEVCTFQAGHGIGHPHLHIELAVGSILGQHLMSAGILRPIKNLAQTIRDRAAGAGIDPEKTLARVKRQMKEQSIIEIGENYLIRSAIPQYKKSRYTIVGIGQTYFIDPRVFLK